MQLGRFPSVFGCVTTLGKIHEAHAGDWIQLKLDAASGFEARWRTAFLQRIQGSPSASGARIISRGEIVCVVLNNK